MVRIAVADIKAGKKIASTFVVKNKKSIYFREKPGYFLSLLLGDKTGNIEAKIWDKAEDYNKNISVGDLVAVNGDVKEFNGNPQLTIHTLKVCSDADFDPADFLPASPLDAGEMLAELKILADSVQEENLQKLLNSFFHDKQWLKMFVLAPAAKINHQAYLGGLLEHTLNVAKAAAAVANLYPRADRDLLIAGSILHDVGKVVEYRYDRVIDFTDQGRLLGHIMLGAGMVERKIDSLEGFPEKLKMKILHIITSHHGQYEWQSPKRPKFLEAAMVHQIDLLDATIDSFTRGMEESQDSDGEWSPYNRTLERHIYLG
jgi:3'-5' exoribonuclease